MDLATQVLSQDAPAPEAAAQPAGQIEIADPRFELIAKLEKKVRQKEQETESRFKDFETKEQRLKELEELAQLMESNPLEALKRKGKSLEDINKLALSTYDDDDLDPVAKKFKEFENLLAEKDKTYEQKMRELIAEKEREIQERESNHQVEQFKSGIKSFISENKETYELLANQENPHEVVYEVIYKDLLAQQEAGNKDPMPMDFKTAAEKIENYLDAEMSKFLSLKKIQSKFGPRDPFNLEKSRPETITKDLLPASLPNAAELSHEERIQLAIEKLKHNKYPVDGL